MSEETRVVLRDGREIVLDDDDDVSLSIIKNGKAVFTFPFPVPSGGYGGGFLMVSPSERYLVFYFYSGESEEAYSLFQITDHSLEPVCGFDYSCGECASYRFSGNEELLVQALPRGLGPWYLEDAEADENGTPFFEYGEINILNLSAKTAERHMLRVYPSERWDEESMEPFSISGITDDGTLRLAMPWGEEQLAFPLEKILTFRPA